jgi:hypothetical protein
MKSYTMQTPLWVYQIIMVLNRIMVTNLTSNFGKLPRLLPTLIIPLRHIHHQLTVHRVGEMLQYLIKTFIMLLSLFILTKLGNLLKSKGIIIWPMCQNKLWVPPNYAKCKVSHHHNNIAQINRHSTLNNKYKIVEIWKKRTITLTIMLKINHKIIVIRNRELPPW